MRWRRLVGSQGLTLCVSVVSIVAALDVYVSPTGSDSNDGSVARPFRTLAHAQTEVRRLKGLNIASPVPINVFLRRGRYELTQTLDFTPQDTGDSVDAPVTYQAYCDAAVEQSMISVEPYPYSTHLATPPRLLWNGNGNKSVWTGPMDPFLEMRVNRTSNGLLSTTTTLLQDPVPVMDIGDVCVDKVNGIGHTCYANTLATCVSGCMTACALHGERKLYTDTLYTKYSHLFGKKLVKEEDCVEVCSLSCRGCETVEISGAKRINPGDLTSWSLHKTLANGRSIFKADLTAVLPSLPTDPSNPTVFSTLYVDNVLLPRAGFPDCLTPTSLAASITEFECTYVAPALTKASTTNTLVYDPAVFSSRLALWTNINLAEVELNPDSQNSLANLRFKIQSIDTTKHEIALGAGGTQLTVETFTNDVSATRAMRFRVENLLEELDSPGEWYFDPSTKVLYIMPLSATTTAATMATLTIEIPLLRQLVRVIGSRENVYTSATHASSSLVESDSTTFARNLVFSQLTFSGTQLLTSDVYEATSSSSSTSESSWPIARVGALFMETVSDITVRHCTFAKVGGNAIVVSGESDNVHLHHNNISYVGSSGILLVSRVARQRNSFASPVLAHTLFSRAANVSFNQIHHFGRRVAHSAAVMVVGATRTTIDGNLIYAFPASTGRAYWIANADGASSLAQVTPALVRGLGTTITIPQTLAQSLSTAYQTTVVVSPGFQVPVVAKLIGAPECPSGTGRIGSLYGEQLPFTYTQCSGCCSVHANTAQLRIVNSGVSWAAATAREVVMYPGQTLELYATSSALFNSITDVYVGFHIVTPNQILEIPSVRAKWQIKTRKCTYADQSYLATCSGPCASTDGCGNSNIAVQQSDVLQCATDFEPDVHSLSCSGPFDGLADCDGTGVPKSHLYYNCSMNCFKTACT